MLLRKSKKQKKILLTILVLLVVIVVVVILLVNNKTKLISNINRKSSNYDPAQASKTTLETAIEHLRNDKEEKGEILEIQDLPRIDNANIDIGDVDSFPVRAICDENVFEIDSNFNVTYIEPLAETNINYNTVPNQYEYTNKDKVEMLIKVTNNDGINTIYSPDKGQRIYARGKKSVYLDYSVNENGIYPMKVLDSNNNERIKNIVINKIDRLPPKDYSITASKIGNKFIIAAKTEDQDADETNVKSGIDHYEYYLIDSSSAETSYLSPIITLDSNLIDKAYVIAYDKAGNSKKSAEVPVIVGSITITPSTTDWTNQNINVDVTWNNIGEGIDKKISTDGGTTYHTYTGSETITKNTKIIAKIEKEGIEEKEELVISNIDKIEPEAFTPRIEEVSDTEIKIVNEVQDGAATTEYGKSGIDKYSYEVYLGTNLIDSALNTTDASWTASNLLPNSTYTINVNVTDKAGNTKTSTMTYKKQLYSDPTVVTLTETDKSTNMIEAKATATSDGVELVGANYKFYIKKSGEDDSKYEEKQNGSSNIVKITGLKNNTNYMVKVEVTDSLGQTTTTQEQMSTDDLPYIGTNDETLKFSDITWQNGKASTTISTNTTYTIEYNINTTNGTWTKATSAGLNVELNTLNHGDKVYARLTDGTNSSNIISVTVSDSIAPTGEIQLEADTVEAGNKIKGTVTAQDNESGIVLTNCKWIMTDNENTLGQNESSYTGGNLSETGTLEIDTSVGGFYYIHILLKDNAENKKEIIKKVVVTMPLTYNYTTTDMVEYDAGQWTEEEIQTLTSKNKYNINIAKETSPTNKFGGFTYAGDSNSDHLDAIRAGIITTSRNKSIAPQSDAGNLEDMSDGWKVFEYGETVDNKRYVKSIVHAGAPENFNATSYTGNKTYGYDEFMNKNNYRDFSMYKDKNLDRNGLIKEVRALAGRDIGTTNDNEFSSQYGTNANYYLGHCYIYNNATKIGVVRKNGYVKSQYLGSGCYGIRPLVILTAGVYVDTNEHTGAGNDRFVLHKDEMPDSSEEGVLDFSEVTWTNGKASTTISTNSVYTIEYQKNSTDGTWTTVNGTSVNLSSLNHGDIIYARITDGVKKGNIASLNIADTTKPTGEITLNSEGYRINATINATVKIQDNESRISRNNCKWILTNSVDELGENADDYTGGVLSITTTSVDSATVTLSITAPSTEGEYFVHVLLVDNAQNKTEMIKRVVVSNYNATDMVEYDAGEWTQEEIQDLKNLNLYNINLNKSASATSGINMTFGGFTYKGDTDSTNIEALNNQKITTSRNASVAPSGGNIMNMSDGWKVLEYGETVDNKKYVKSIIHAGTPENFTYHYNNVTGNANRALYILSSGTMYTSYNTYNPRNWDVYRDKTLESKGYIKEVHIINNSDLDKLGSDEKRKTGSLYWVCSLGTSSGNYIKVVNNAGTVSQANTGNCGARPVVTFNDGVYIDTNEHTGTGLDKFVLHKDGE